MHWLILFTSMYQTICQTYTHTHTKKVYLFDYQVGYNAGDGVAYYAVPKSMTDHIYDIEESTNIGTRGRWLFRLDTEGKTSETNEI